MSTTPYPSPPQATARRLEWQHLPPYVRTLIERRLGSKVVAARSQGAGFTPGFASVLRCEDGTQHFVKAASRKAQRPFAEAYRTEARNLRGLPPEVAAPRLLWLEEDEDWVVLATRFVAATNPSRPWQADEFEACLEALETLSGQLTPVPATLKLDSVASDFADWPAYWSELTVPDREAYAAEAAALAGDFAAHLSGDSLVHTDIRADNILLDADGTVWFCDWNWPATGAAWIDALTLLIGPRGDGLDVESAIAASPLLSTVPAESIDTALALFTGYFLKSAGDPVPPTSPHIREHQLWQGEVCWAWLCERRGW